ncbi:GNAT family N-acetyltransferase [Shewanella surugensis]|uniref:GNAT family N-acetyltransferase n=1 Tax=Shewanella surugensis TaxID=212020 RepID=A0ABT0LBN2_9GAMM|nr:GNAT family N-acetyltransferase [Shewanella surugensis]MCL1125068.1 GNAT family N-acetyltransferase [Shewanella surugensis]
MLKIDNYHSLTTEEKQRQQVYIHEVFGDVPFIQQRQWAQPDFVFAFRQDDDLFSFFNLIIRDVIFDRKRTKIAGVSNAVTPKNYRGKGYASQLLTQASPVIFNQLKVEHALLLCSNDLTDFYQHLGWYKVDSKVQFEQRNGIEHYQSNTLLLSPNTPVNPESIDLNGLPW